MEAVARGRPLPLGAVANRRSLVHVGNLAAAIAFCLEHEQARGAFLVSDGEDLSSRELVERVARALGCPARLVPVPPALMRLAGTLLGRRAEVDRLLGDLAVAPTRLAALGFRPPVTVDAALAETAAWFRSRRG
jgi:UDP-glucose 4-epimerase